MLWVHSSGVLRGIWTKYVLGTRAQIDAEARIALRDHGPDALDRQLVVVVLTAMLSLLMVRFLGRPHQSEWLETLLQLLGFESLSGKFHYAMHEHSDLRFNRRVYWVIARLVAYAGVPILVIRLILRKRVRDFGASIKGIGKYTGPYLVMGAVMMPVLFAASFGAGFQSKYPYYPLQQGEPLWPFFIGWELLYALQFVALEFFFRGFLVHGLKARLGFASVFVMMMPYLMIHFGKPLPEAVGSVIAGFALGTMSLRSNSIWWGAALHVLAAWSMDWLSIWHRGLL